MHNEYWYFIACHFFQYANTKFLLYACHFARYILNTKRKRKTHFSPWRICNNLLDQMLLFSHSVVTLCDAVDCSTPDLPVLHHPPELAQTHVHWVGDTIPPSHPLSSPSPPAFNLFSASGSFLMSRLFISGGQNIGASASASVLPLNIQGLFPLGLTGLISLQVEEPSSVFSAPQFKKHQFFSA